MQSVNDLPAGVMEVREPRRWLIQLCRWGLLVLLLILWEAGSALGWIDRFYFSCPSEIVKTAIINDYFPSLP